MNRMILSLTAMLLCISTAYAQTEPTVQHNSGASALLFDLKGLSTIGADNYKGGFGAMTYISDNVAVRAGVGFGIDDEKKNNTAKDETTTTTLSISPGIRYNVFNKDNVALYVGGEIVLGMASQTNDANGSQISKVSATTFGGGLFSGAEWFPWKNISLMLEYGLGYTATTSKLTNAAGVESDGPETTSAKLGITSANFTLGWYFN